jgi:hypothetical protein
VTSNHWRICPGLLDALLPGKGVLR